MKNREELITSIITEQIKSDKLSSIPKSTELLPYVRLNIKKKRLRNKFLKTPIFYFKRLSKEIALEYSSKRLGHAFSGVVWDTLNRESFARRILRVQPLNDTEIK